MTADQEMTGPPMPDGWPTVPMGVEHLTFLTKELAESAQRCGGLVEQFRPALDAGELVPPTMLVHAVAVLLLEVDLLATTLGALLAERVAQLDPSMVPPEDAPGRAPDGGDRT